MEELVEFQWATAIRERRLDLGKAQTAIWRMSNGQLGNKVLSRIETGEKNPASLSTPQVKILLDFLEWTPEEFRAATGIDIYSGLERPGLPEYANVFERRRRELGMSQATVALRSGASQTLVGKIEQGMANPCHAKYGRNIAQVLGIPESELERLCQEGQRSMEGEEESGFLMSIFGSPEKLAEAAGISLPAAKRLQHDTGLLAADPLTLLKVAQATNREPDELTYVGLKAAGQAIKARREFLGLNQEEFARRAGVSSATVTKIERGLHNLPMIKMNTLQGLLKALQWGPEEFSRATGVTYPAFEEVKLVDYEIPIGIVGAGPPWENEESETMVISASEIRGRDKELLFALKVVGDSMSPTLQEGDILICYRDDGLVGDGTMAVIWLPDEGVVVKRLARKGDIVLMVSDNAIRYPPVPIPDHARVIGPVLKIEREVFR